MGIAVVLALLALVTLGLAGASIWGGSQNRPGFIAGAIGAFVLTALVLLFSTYTSVGPSDVAVVTAFGHTEGDLGPGLHFIAPWKATTTWDGSVQTISYGRDTDQAHPDHCLLVRIGGQQSACITVTFQYQVERDAVDSLFVRYRTQQNMNGALVVRDLDGALNTQLQSFSPIQALAAGNPNGASLVPYAARVKAQMTAEIGSDIRVVAVVLPFAQYDPQTTSRLNQFQAQIADTLIATQQVKTNAQLALANSEIARSVANPNVIEQQCVTNVLIPLVKAGLNPQGVNCFPGGGSSATVVIPKG